MEPRPRSTRVLLDEVDHRHRCRRRELELLIERAGEHFAAPILELGSGDGLQGTILAERFGAITGTDVDVSRFRGPFPIVRTTGERLPFRTGAFGTVFSSSVLEHVNDLDRALVEMRRVLRPGGHMIHIVPTQFWISLTLGLRLPYMLARRAYRAVHGGRRDDPDWQRWWYAGHDIQWSNVFSVPVHGVSPSHREEWRAFGHARWASHFRRARMDVVASVDLYTYSPYGFLGGAERFRLALARFGLPTVRAYVLAPRP
jgi:SAM-dependent methyltransferase